MHGLVPNTIGASLLCPESTSDPPLGLGRVDPEPAPPVELEHPTARMATAAANRPAARDPAGLGCVYAPEPALLNEPAKALRLACRELPE